MDKQYAEIAEIPVRALDFWSNSPDFNLPLSVPYLGMGSSYFAPLAFRMMGLPIYPEIASEYYNYLHKAKTPYAVILSQSGRSSESLWCGSVCENYTAISNYADSALCIAENCDQKVALMAGIEQYSSSNTYINTLLTLFKGLGFDAEPALHLLVSKMGAYESAGKQMAEKLFAIIKREPIHGIFILGSGPNIATAMQAALILSESTKINFSGMAMAQYDHGPKETALKSIVIQILAPGPSYERGEKLINKMRIAGAHTMTVCESEIHEHYSVLHNIIPFNFMAYYLSQLLGVRDTFLVGGKVTEVN